MLLKCAVGGDSWEFLGLQDPTSPSERKSILNIHWKDRCWSWNSNDSASWFKEVTHWKRLWCWERLRAGGKGDNRGWDGWIASPTQWTWVWVNLDLVMHRETWHAVVYGAAESQTWVSDWTELIWNKVLMIRILARIAVTVLLIK